MERVPLLGIQGQGMVACSHSLIELPRKEIQALAASTKAKEWGSRGAGGAHPMLNQLRSQHHHENASSSAGKQIYACLRRWL